MARTPRILLILSIVAFLIGFGEIGGAMMAGWARLGRGLLYSFSSLLARFRTKSNLPPQRCRNILNP